jgi:hypothetical protein
MSEAMRRSALAVILAGFIVVGTAAAAAGPYDGTWDGQATSTGRCRGDMSLTVAGTEVAGKFSAVGYEASITGTMSADGSFAGTLAGRSGSIKIFAKIANGGLAGQIPTSTCGVPMDFVLNRK